MYQKDIPGYEGLYQANTAGQIISLLTGKVLKPFQFKTGYTQTSLRKNNTTDKHNTHRLIALTFIPNPESKPAVNHINTVKFDNYFNNLEWVTDSENTIHAFKTGRLLTTPVLQFSLTGVFIKEWPSVVSASSFYGVDHSNISACCSGKIKTSCGYLWTRKINTD